MKRCPHCQRTFSYSHYCSKLSRTIREDDRSIENPTPAANQGSFGTSMAYGYALDNGLLGGVLGGNMAGGMLGQSLRDSVESSTYSDPSPDTSSSSSSDSGSSYDGGGSFDTSYSGGGGDF